MENEQIMWLRRLMGEARKASEGAPGDSKSIAMVAFLDRVANGEDPANAAMFAERLAKASNRYDNLVTLENGGFFVSAMDPDAIFQGRGIYLPLLRLVAQDLLGEYGIRVDGIGNNISLIDQNSYGDPNINPEISELLDAANVVFERYGLGTVGWGWENADWNFVADEDFGNGYEVVLQGNPYPGCGEDSVEIRFD